MSGRLKPKVMLGKGMLKEYFHTRLIAARFGTKIKKGKEIQKSNFIFQDQLTIHSRILCKKIHHSQD
jgi:hypothetical protein